MDSVNSPNHRVCGEQGARERAGLFLRRTHSYELQEEAEEVSIPFFLPLVWKGTKERRKKKLSSGIEREKEREVV